MRQHNQVQNNLDKFCTISCASNLRPNASKLQISKSWVQYLIIRCFHNHTLQKKHILWLIFILTYSTVWENVVKNIFAICHETIAPSKIVMFFSTIVCCRLEICEQCQVSCTLCSRNFGLNLGFLIFQMASKQVHFLRPFSIIGHGFANVLKGSVMMF